MKILLVSLASLATACLFWFCKHQPKFSADNLPTQQLRWGTGGGFVGKETSYTMLKNGQVFLSEMAGPLTETANKKSKSAAAIFKTVEALNLAKLEFNYPGNTYSFIELKDGDAVSRVAWGDPTYTVSSEVKELFERLNGLVKK
jgi:hypothetical protein